MKIVIWDENFSIVKANDRMKDEFATIQDKNELTIIIDENKVEAEKVIEIEKDYKLITFDGVLPFTMTGFIAKISNALAEQEIPIFVISSYSTDHILIKEKYLEKTLEILKNLGFEK